MRPPGQDQPGPEAMLDALLDGGPLPGGDPDGLQPVAEVLAALRAPAAPAELAGAGQRAGRLPCAAAVLRPGGILPPLRRPGGPAGPGGPGAAARPVAPAPARDGVRRRSGAGGRAGGRRVRGRSARPGREAGAYDRADHAPAHALGEPPPRPRLPRLDAGPAAHHHRNRPAQPHASPGRQPGRPRPGRAPARRPAGWPGPGPDGRPRRLGQPQRLGHARSRAPPRRPSPARNRVPRPSPHQHSSSSSPP